MATHKGKEILPLLNLVQKNAAVGTKATLQLLDNKTSRKIVFDKSGTPQQTATYRYAGLGRDQFRTVQSFYTSHRGRQVSFYVPTLFQDVQIVENAAQGTNTIVVEDTLFADVYLSNKNNAHYRELCILQDGAVFPIVVSSSVPDRAAGNETLVIAGTLPVAVTPASFVCFLQLVRFAEDTMTIEFVTPYHANIDVPVVRLVGESVI